MLEWSPVFIFAGSIVTAVSAYLIGRRSSKAAEKATDVEIIAEYRTMKNDIKDELNQRIEELEERWNEKFDEVLGYFGQYVAWARAGAKPPAPFIPTWIFDRIKHQTHREI